MSTVRARKELTPTSENVGCLGFVGPEQAR